MSVAAKGKKEEPEKKPRRRIKKVAGHGGHHGGSWKVAYADFVTAMMALFLVLWLLSQADQKLKVSVASYFRSAGVFETQAGGILGGPNKVSQDPAPDATIEQAMLNSIAEELKKRVTSSPELAAFKDRVKINVTEDGLSIQIIDKADRVTFASGSAELSTEAKALLAEIAKVACKMPNPIAIGGHTDKHLFPEGSTYSNWELSADRANAARRALESGCVKAEQVRRVIGYADTELLYPNQPFAAANRRINITILRLHAVSQPTGNGKPTIVGEKASSKDSEANEAAEEESSQKKSAGKEPAKKGAGSDVSEEESTEETKGTEKKHGKAHSSTKAAETPSAPTKQAHK